MDRSGKVRALRRLAERRKAARRGRYKCLGDFHKGFFECSRVSPWSKAAGNVNAKVMVVGQDWASADMLARTPPNRRWAEFGFDRDFPTNVYLDELLKRHFGLKRAQCYLTNLFVLIKPGGVSSIIPMKDLVWSAEEFTIPEISIVRPRVVICLGLRAFRALGRAAGHRLPRIMADAIKTSFPLEASMVHCVAHTGAFGTNNRSRRQVERDWRKLAKSYGAVKVSR